VDRISSTRSANDSLSTEISRADQREARSGNHKDIPLDLTRTGEPVSLADEPRIFIYDNYPGGIGFSEPLFAMDAELRRRTRDLIAGCQCQHGCPTCVGPIGNTGPLAKTVALRILDLLQAETSAQAGASAQAETSARTRTELPA
jgi:ATP-dependent helicase YprA (DUF1998 family)